MAHWGWYWKINKKHLLRNWMKKATFMILFFELEVE